MPKASRRAANKLTGHLDGLDVPNCGCPYAAIPCDYENCDECKKANWRRCKCPKKPKCKCPKKPPCDCPPRYPPPCEHLLARANLPGVEAIASPRHARETAAESAPPLPAAPTEAMGGTADKIRAMIARVANVQDVHHPADNPLRIVRNKTAEAGIVSRNGTPALTEDNEESTDPSGLDEDGEHWEEAYDWDHLAKIRRELWDRVRRRG